MKDLRIHCHEIIINHSSGVKAPLQNKTVKQKTKIDFSKHEVKTIWENGILIHDFRDPSTPYCGLTFINTCGVMTVTGDFGNWVFSREFHPCPDFDNGNGVSRNYWDEKLESNSVQSAMVFDTDATEKAIRRFRKEFKGIYDRKMTQEERDWLDDLYNYTREEWRYIYHAYYFRPFSIDAEDVPIGKIRNKSLEAVYDGFNALSKAMAKDKINYSK